MWPFLKALQSGLQSMPKPDMHWLKRVNKTTVLIDLKKIMHNQMVLFCFSVFKLEANAHLNTLTCLKRAAAFIFYENMHTNDMGADGTQPRALM